MTCFFPLQVRDVFQTYAKMLEKIAHLMPPDLQRLLDKESQVKLLIKKAFRRLAIFSIYFAL